MADIRVLVAAAGRGSRAGLPYPKTLFALQGKPILLRLLDVLAPYDEKPTIVVSPDGEAPVKDCLASAGFQANIVLQPEPRGMGDAVLRFEESPAAAFATNVLLVWGDIPFLQLETVAAIVRAHVARGNDFTFATRMVDAAYTVVSRGPTGQVTGVVETRETNAPRLLAGERDVGVFIFRTALVLPALREDLEGKIGLTTGEHGFLYLIKHLAARTCRVEGLAVGTEMDLVSLNSMKDVHTFL